MPSQNQDRIKQEKGETIKRQRSKKSVVHNEVSIPDALREVETFLMTEMQKSDQERDSDQSILYLTEDQLISNEKSNLNLLPVVTYILMLFSIDITESLPTLRYP